MGKVQRFLERRNHCHSKNLTRPGLTFSAYRALKSFKIEKRGRLV